MVYNTRPRRSYKEEAEFTAEIINFQSIGYKISEGNPSVKIETPSGKIYSRLDLENILKKLEFGNRKQIEALQALELLNLYKEYNC